MRLYWLCVLPLLLLAAWLAYSSVQTVRAQQDQQATHLTENFAKAVDQHLRARINALSIIAGSPHLDAPDEWADLYHEAAGLRESQDIQVTIVEAGPARRMVFSTHLPFGSPLPPTPRTAGFQAMPAALASRQPAVGDALISPFTGKQIVAVAVPALRNGQATHAVVTPVDTVQFQRLLDGFSLPEGWLMFLRDGAGQVLARVPPGEATAGQPVEKSNRFAVQSGLSRWEVVLEIPRAVRQAPLLATGGALGLLVLLTTLAGALMGMVGGRRLGLAVASLTHADPGSSDLGITEIHQAQALLTETVDRVRSSEARFRRLFQDAPVGMRLCDLEGRVLAQNDRFDEMFGYSIQEVPTLEVWMRCAYPDPAARRLVKDAWGSALERTGAQERKALSGEYRVTRKDGQQRVVQVHGSLLTDGLLSNFIDVTEQREAEASLRLWAAAFEHAELNLAISDPASNTLLVVNPAFARARGYEPAEMAGMGEADTFPAECRAGVQQALQRLQSSMHGLFESRHIRKDGSSFPVLLDVTVLFGANGKPVSRLTYAIDLTERKQAEADIQALHASLERRVADRTAKLSQANEELDSFAYTVSHDLRAPLRAMDGYLHLLRDEHGAELVGDAQHCLNQIEAATERMTHLIDGILSLSHNVRHELQSAHVDLSAMVANRLQELAHAEPERQVHTEVQPGLTATGDPRMLDVLVTNLVDNAWKYTGKTPAPSIRFFARERDGKSWFCLADNGAGFDPAHTEKLFQPFQRMHRQDEFPGIGIGLATVARIVQRHGGTIVAESSTNKGATFAFTLAAHTTGV